ncbi:MAG: hypothetical protein ACKVWV_13025 [Planctomycetota bacterium]
MAAISKSPTNIHASGEFARAATVSKVETVRKERARGVKRSNEQFNRDAVIPVGHRVNSTRAKRRPDLGRAEEIGRAFVGFQKYLYQQQAVA